MQKWGVGGQELNRKWSAWMFFVSHS